MTREDLTEQINNELPSGWKLIGIRENGMIQVESEKLNVVISGLSWAWVKQRMTSFMLSAR